VNQTVRMNATISLGHRPYGLAILRNGFDYWAWSALTTGKRAGLEVHLDRVSVEDDVFLRIKKLYVEIPPQWREQTRAYRKT
jgi:hypothetical protein